MGSHSFGHKEQYGREKHRYEFDHGDALLHGQLIWQPKLVA
jgi:hypothetical protein